MDRRHSPHCATLLALAALVLGGCQRDPSIGQPNKDSAPEARADGAAASGWAISAGGAGPDGKGGQIVVDGAGDLVITGPFSGTATFGDKTIRATGASGRYVAKLRAADHSFVWVAPIQGNLQVEHTSGLATDHLGQIYLSGSFSGTATFGEGSRSIALTSKGEIDLFAAKLDLEGRPIWAVPVAGPGSGPLTSSDNTTHAYRVAVDEATGQVTVAGAFREAGLGGDVFVARLGSDGQLLWAVPGGGGGDQYDVAEGLAVDRAGNSFVTGYLGYGPRPKFPVATFGDIVLPVPNSPQLFVAKIDASGQFKWVVLGEQFRTGHDVALDDSGNIYVARLGGVTELLLAVKLDAGGKELWDKRVEFAGTRGTKTYYHGTGSQSLIVDGAGHVTVCGMFSGTVSLGSELMVSSGAYDAFVAELDPSGNVVWAQHAGGPGSSWATSLSRDKEGNLYVAGYFEQSADFGGTRLTSKGESDFFVWKIPVVQ